MTNSSHDKGFAPAAGAIEDGAIHTSLQGLEAGDAVLPCGAPAYYAMPEEGRNLPVVLVAQEIFGLHEHIRDIVRRFGKLGYFAIAPDFIIRYGDPSTAQDIDAIREIVAKVPELGNDDDLRRSARFRRKQGRRPVARRRHRLLLGRTHCVALCGA